VEVPPPPLPSYDRVAETYRRIIADLKPALTTGRDELRAEVFSTIRDLIEKIVLRPTGRYAPIDIEVHSRLPGLLRSSEQTTTDSQSGD
jgi:hypothetical protein